MSATATSPKETLRNLAGADNLKTFYSGHTRTMFVSGTESKVKSFLRKMNLKGKGAFPFGLKQGKVTQD